MEWAFEKTVKLLYSIQAGRRFHDLLPDNDWRLAGNIHIKGDVRTAMYTCTIVPLVA